MSGGRLDAAGGSGRGGGGGAAWTWRNESPLCADRPASSGQIYFNNVNVARRRNYGLAIFGESNGPAGYGRTMILHKSCPKLTFSF